MEIKGSITITNIDTAEDIQSFLAQLPNSDMWHATIGNGEITLTANYTK